MKIIKGNCLQELKKIVQSKAKFQKVMLLFDDSISNVEISEIYECVKGECVYNQSHVSSIDKNEIYNGYKLIIYCGTVEGFLKLNLDLQEFVKVFIIKENRVLPYFLTNNNKIDGAENFLIIEENLTDLQMFASVWFNAFYNYFKYLMFGKNNFIQWPLINEEVTQINVCEFVSNLDEEFEFADMLIVKEAEVDYKDIVIVDLILINAFLLLIEAIKSRNYMLVDVFKATNEDENEIDRFYKLFNNEQFVNSIILNYHCLHSYCIKTKQKILQLLDFVECDLNKVNDLTEQVKSIVKKNCGLLGYLYLYDIFSV